MVMRGQYLERATVIPAGELSLEGLFHRGRRGPAALIIAPIAEGGSPMEVPQVAEIAWALHKANRPTLRFNPRGFGASQGQRGTAAERLEDARAALRSLRESVAFDIAAVGVQSGAETALALGMEGGIAGLVLVAPVGAVLLQGWALPGFAVVPEGEAERAASLAPLRITEVEGAGSDLRRGLPLLGQAVALALDRIS
jgi:pimeloyl-ACP methyl ester carboxylesterase